MVWFYNGALPETPPFSIKEFLLVAWRAVVKLPRWVIAWLVIMASAILSMPVACAVFSPDFLPFVWFGAILVIWPINGYYMWRFQGLVKFHGLPHIPPLLIAIIFGVIRLSTASAVGPKLTYVSNPALYVINIIYIVIFVICLFLDERDVYIWFWKQKQDIISGKQE